ncbi:MAG: ShlB/FhaC/HecB family hemolysin secretion/activation protein [Candidatus Omnitrophota bacterium]
MRRPCKIVLHLFILLFLFTYPVFAQNPASKTGGLDRLERDIDRDKRITDRIERPREEEEEEGLVKEEKFPIEGEKKTLVRKIEIRGITLIQKRVVDNIISEYEGKELTIAQMQKICDLITDEYRKKGYVTSRAYLPPQTIRDGLLVIMVIEGRLGSLTIEGNRYFSEPLIRKKIELKPGVVFDYKSLQDSLRRVNEHPDRRARAILVPGKEPGTTDIVIKVEDRLPVHIGTEFDNFGSRYTEKWRFSAIAEHNNLLGFDDKFYFKYQKSQDSLQHFYNFRYIFPLIQNWTDIGFYYVFNKVRLVKEYKDIGVKGRSTLAGVFISQRLLDDYNIDLRLNGGFDYKRIINILGGAEDSKDEPRVFRGGFDLDLTDAWGRTILTFETDVAVTNFLGGSLKEDVTASRPGARGDFTKFIAYLYRLQPMPFSSNILWKNQFQFSNSTLFASEQFQVGGIVSVRGYPPAEINGDSGYASSIEWSFPILYYLLPKSVHSTTIPLSETVYTDAFRFVAFYDFGGVYNNKKLPQERKQKFIHGYGFGVRFNLAEDLSARVEFAGPLGSNPSDDRTFRTYFGINKKF